jgi:hypothetical protein
MRRTKLVLTAVTVMVAVMLPVGTAQACACGVPDWSMMSDEQIVSAVNGAQDEPRILAGQSGELPPAPAGYQYDDSYMLVPISV